MKDLNWNVDLILRDNFRIIEEEINKISPNNHVQVSSIDHLPKAGSNGIIVLKDNTAYYFTGEIDLKGARLHGGKNTCLLGPSSENAFITSTGLAADIPLFLTHHTTPIRHLTFSNVHTALFIDGESNSPALALDWYGVNFLNVNNIGVIKNSDNFIYTKGAFLNSQELVFRGSVGTISIFSSILRARDEEGDLISLPSGLAVTRRFRLFYSSVILGDNSNGINANEAANIAAEGFQLDHVNFAGGTEARYLPGTSFISDKALIEYCRGVTNTAVIGHYYMINNAAPTVIASKSIKYKIAGSTVANGLNQKFTHSDNKVVYTGAFTRTFAVSVVASATGGNNQNVRIFIAKNGTVLPESEMPSNTDGAGRDENISTQTLVSLATGDYLEVFIQNATSATNLTVEYLNLIAKGN